MNIFYVTTHHDHFQFIAQLEQEFSTFNHKTVIGDDADICIMSGYIDEDVVNILQNNHFVNIPILFVNLYPNRSKHFKGNENFYIQNDVSFTSIHQRANQIVNNKQLRSSK